MQQVDLAVIGAGPAGMHAALCAAEAGATVALIDGYPRPGGQYFRQLPAAFRASDRTRHQRAAGVLFSRLEASGAAVIPETVAWGAFPATAGEGYELALSGPSAPPALLARNLVLATGAYDRPIPFPGWTLPGVMTAGAAQTLIKSQRVLPGRRVLLAGTGPLQLAVAASLARAGAGVVAVLEGARLNWQALLQAPAMWRQWQRLAEAWTYSRALAPARVPYRLGWAVIAARGDGQVQEAVIARLDHAWRPISGSEQVLQVDAILTGYGFIPSGELGRMLGCRHAYDPRAGGYVPLRDDTMQTTLPGVYAAGDGAGIGGAELAALEGEVAGLAVAQRHGCLEPAFVRRRLARLRPRLAREARFARMLGRLFTPGPGLWTLARADTPICRCEEVTLGDIRAAVADGVRSTAELKALTRLGMGNCQGRICGEIAARLLAQETGLGEGYLAALHDTGVFTSRPPVHPITLAQMAAGAEE